MKPETPKNDMLKIRMDKQTMSLLESASTYADVNKSKFIRQSIREKATAIIAEHERTRFTEQDWRLFFELIDNPPEATERMKKAIGKYQEIKNDNES